PVVVKVQPSVRVPLLALARALLGIAGLGGGRRFNLATRLLDSGSRTARRHYARADGEGPRYLAGKNQFDPLGAQWNQPGLEQGGQIHDLAFELAQGAQTQLRAARFDARVEARTG